MKHMTLVIAALFPSACTTDAIVRTAFPDRENFTFLTADKEGSFTYACEDNGSQAATLKNAQLAHQYTDRNMQRIVDNGVTLVLAGKDYNSYLERESGKLVEDVEARYQCLAYGFDDA